MLEIVIAVVSVILVFIALSLCIAVCNKYICDRNMFRDKWIDAVEDHNDYLVRHVYDLENEIDDLKRDIEELKKGNEEETTNA